MKRPAHIVTRKVSRAFTRSIQDLMWEDQSIVPPKEPLVVTLGRAGGHMPQFDVISFLAYLEIMKAQPEDRP